VIEFRDFKPEELIGKKVIHTWGSAHNRSKEIRIIEDVNEEFFRTNSGVFSLKTGIERGDKRSRCKLEKRELWLKANKDKLNSYARNYYSNAKKLDSNDDIENYLFRKHNCASATKKKGKLSREEIKLILINQDYKCNITKLNFKSNDLMLPSVDRLDSDKDYSIENCQIIFTGLNLLKNKFSQKDLALFLKYIKKSEI
jgi:hypothetical protein